MDDKTLWGAAFFVYILLITPKYLIASSEVEKTIENFGPFGVLMSSWIVGFAVILVTYNLQIDPVASFIASLLVWLISYFIFKRIK